MCYTFQKIISIYLKFSKIIGKNCERVLIQLIKLKILCSQLRTFGQRQINVMKLFPEVIIVWSTIFTDPDLNCATWNKKLWIFSRLCHFLLFLISACNMGRSFYWWITCFHQTSQYPPSLFFASLSWDPKPAGTSSFKKTWQ